MNFFSLIKLKFFNFLRSLNASKIKLIEQNNILKKKLNDVYLNNKKKRILIHEHGDKYALEHNKIESTDKYFKKFSYSQLKRYIKFSISLKNLIKENNIQINNKRILDLGCGPGLVIKYLLKTYNFKDVYCVDSSKVAIQKVNEIFPIAKTKIINMINDDFDYLKDFDLIFCTEVIEHIQEYENILKKINKLMKNDTVVFLTVPDGRLDQSMFHINFFTKISLEVIIKKIFFNCDYSINNFNDSAICAIIKIK
jgi:2-polyprenyl-3-methyl-5-hydroxy-6-metoxy-1,4-benzoquinol methylase